MPLSFGFPLGLAIVVVSAILFFATKCKKIAQVVLVIGAIVTLLTFLLNCAGGQLANVIWLGRTR
jgi:hypothetical protein